MKPHRSWSLVVALVPLLLGATACGRERSAAPGSQSPGSSPSAITGQPGIGASASPGSSGGTSVGWKSDPVIVQRNVSVPPVPVLTAIRAATHSGEGYDRIVFDFQGVLPGYEIRYVPEVRGDPSDLPVNVPGRGFLQVTFRPAQAHTDAGQATVTPRAQTLNYPMMKAYAIVGDFEAVLTIAIGLDDVVGFRVGEMPGRIYLDVAA
jgi:hypothetical protein